MQQLCSESTIFQEPIMTPGLGGVQLVYKNLNFSDSSSHFLLQDDTPRLDTSALKELPASKELIVLYERNVNLMKSSFFEGDLPQDLPPDLPPELIHPATADDSGSTEAIMEQYMDLSAPPSPMPTVAEQEMDIKKPQDNVLMPRLFEIGAFHDVPIIFPRNYIDMAVYHNKSFKVGWKKGKTFLMYHNEFEPPETMEPEDIAEDAPDRCRKINILELDNTNYDVKITPTEVSSTVNTMSSLTGYQNNCVFIKIVKTLFNLPSVKWLTKTAVN